MDKKITRSTEVFKGHQAFDWREQLEENRKVVFPSRFCEEACTLILKQQEEIMELKSRLATDVPDTTTQGAI